MKFIYVFSITLLISTLMWGQNSEKRIRAVLTDKSINLDGIIEEEWNLADSISSFVQFSPYNNEAPSENTVAKFLSTETSLYFLLVCYSQSTPIQANRGTHDQFTGDIISLMLDTFGDKKTAYKFAVNASGVRADSRLLDDGRNRDYSWDGIWFAASKIYDWGYVIEVDIPYKSIQYDENLFEWGLDIDRWIPYRNEDIYLCSYKDNEGQRVSKFGKLIFDNFKPSAKGLNFEIYPVAISKGVLTSDNKYKVDPEAGIDVFYNPSQKLTLQFTANPDFAQIEADPYSFNLSRYENYFSERRPFFTEGNEIFMASGRERNSGFYRPLELFYSRRIGKSLPDGSVVPLQAGSKIFGRSDDWEYGAFVAKTGRTDYTSNGNSLTEPDAYFTSFRLKKQILENSSVGVLYAGKHTSNGLNGVIDIDGAVRQSDWQLAYQIAHSISRDKTGLALSTGFNRVTKDWLFLFRARHIDEHFNINEVGYVPWKGNSDGLLLTGPMWYFDTGEIKQITTYIGPGWDWTKADDYIDKTIVTGFNFNFRKNWGFEVNLSYAKKKDLNVEYTGYDINFSSWINPKPTWNLNFWGGYEKAYNFYRDYLATDFWVGNYFSWKILPTLGIGNEINTIVEYKPDGSLEDATYNSRPFVSITPVNDFNVRIYIDNVYTHSSGQMQRLLIGLLLSYNFSPKSWIYLAYSEGNQRESTLVNGSFYEHKMKLTQRAAIVKIKYLYYL
ncbi:MAG TPA: DUF5916 domain-containing protein [Ignavibacteriaceae bacterium]|nr:DUF5916 domain-containing protein [Ignavibacteriaceae bacterium]